MAKKLSWAWLILIALTIVGWIGVGMYENRELRILLGASLGMAAFLIATFVAIGYVCEK